LRTLGFNPLFFGSSNQATVRTLRQTAFVLRETHFPARNINGLAVDNLPVNQLVAGSSPAAGAKSHKEI
jgi:hypothetical protein